MLEGARLREARQMKLLARGIVQLLSPYLEKGASVQWVAEGILGGDPEARVLAERAKRLKALPDEAA